MSVEFKKGDKVTGRFGGRQTVFSGTVDKVVDGWVSVTCDADGQVRKTRPGSLSKK